MQLVLRRQIIFSSREGSFSGLKDSQFIHRVRSSSSSPLLDRK